MPSGAKVGYFHLKVKNNAENFQAKGIPKYRGCHENVAKTLLHLLNHLIFWGVKKVCVADMAPLEPAWPMQRY